MISFYTTMPTKRAPSAFARPQSAAAATWSSNIAVSTAIVAVSAAAVFWSGVKLLRRTTKRSSTPSHRAETASALVRPRNCGRYQKGKEIGRGAFGAVYIGLDPKSGEMVAIKEMGAVSAAELRKEFDLLSGKAHPHVVAVKGYEVSGGKARLYLEWVAGGSLSDIMQRFGPVEERRLKTYVRQIVEGLQFLHQQGILHRDIKPKNILVDHTGALKLTDFGLSRHFASMHDQTRAAGTPLYMAPECMRGNFSVGSDIWAVGATMTELTTGELPWSHVDSRLMENVHVIMYHIGSQAGQRGHHPHHSYHFVGRMSELYGTLLCTTAAGSRHL